MVRNASEKPFQETIVPTENLSTEGNNNIRDKLR